MQNLPRFSDGRPWTCADLYRQRPDGGWHIPDDVLRKHCVSVNLGRAKACDSAPRKGRARDSDEERLLELIRKYLRASSKGTAIVEPEEEHDDSIPARAYRDIWQRRENQDARRLRAADSGDDSISKLNAYYHSRHGQIQPGGESKAPCGSTSLSDHSRVADARVKAMDALPLTFHERLQAQVRESGPAYFPEWQ